MSLSRNYGSYLYLFKCNQYVKVGVTKDLNKRIESLDAYNPFESELINSFYYTDKSLAFYVENIIHKKLKLSSKHHKYEWFVCDEECIDEINHIVSIYSNNFLSKKLEQYDALILLREMIIKEKGINTLIISKLLKLNSMPNASQIISYGSNYSFVIPEDNSEEVCLHLMIENISKESQK